MEPGAFASEDEIDATRPRAPAGVKLLICFLVADAARSAIELVGREPEIVPYPTVAIFVLWLVIELLLAVLLIWKARAGLYLTQAILAVHVFYFGHELAWSRPHLWLAMTFFTRAKILLSVFLDGIFVAYLASAPARDYLNDEP